MNDKFENEKREMEIRWATERNVLERAFAEEKMEMMNRLQVSTTLSLYFHEKRSKRLNLLYLRTTLKWN